MNFSLDIYNTVIINTTKIDPFDVFVIYSHIYFQVTNLIGQLLGSGRPTM